MQTIKESSVANIWQYTARPGVALSTVDRQPVHILYPGRTSDEPGADIRDAVLRVNGRVLKGNIEIHVRSSDWRKHGHHLDKAYNGIVLHVVMFHDTGYTTCLENGELVPVISLCDSAPKIDFKHWYSSPLTCSVGMRGKTQRKIDDVLDRAGRERFIEKQKSFLRELEYIDAGQCLYRGLMGALGYSKNTAPFQMVAEIVPLSELERMAGETSESCLISAIEERLLKVAGFAGGIENPNRSINNVVIPNKLAWRLFRVRPGNQPARRLAGMARLIVRYRHSGLLSGLISLANGAIGENRWDEIESGLIVPADGYWVDHYCPGKQCHLTDGFLIGRTRAKEIIINVLLPFISASGKYDNRPDNVENALELYNVYPATEGNNIERHMSNQLGIKRSQIKTAQRQQGLLHLYKRFCTQGGCGECPVQDLNTNR
jgi:hypothetical protein